MYTTLEGTQKCDGMLRSVAVGLVIGAAVGAAAGLLLAPKSGARLRRDLKAQADHLRRKAADLCDDATEVAEDLAARGKQFAEKVRA